MKEMKLRMLHDYSRILLKKTIDAERARHGIGIYIASGRVNNFLKEHGYADQDDVIDTVYLDEMLRIMGFIKD